MMLDEEFKHWWARNHPWDWYAKETNGPIPHNIRLHVWHLARAAWMREEIGQRRTEGESDGR